MNDVKREKNLSDATGEMSLEDIAYNAGVRDALVSVLNTLEQKKDRVAFIEEPGVKFVKSILAEALVIARSTRTRRISQN